jgi:hypothetical protein
MKKLTLSIFLAFLASVTLWAQTENWKLRTNKNGIKVYTQKVEGSSFEAFKGETVLNCKLTTAVAVLRDIPSYPQWIYMTDTALVLKTEGNEMYLYSVSKAPWPVSKRDVPYLSRMDQNPDTREVLISLTAVPDYIPPKPGMVRIPKANGFWKLTPIEADKVKVAYQMHSETGGSIPAWLSNMAATDAPYNILLKLHERVLLEKYRTASPEGIVP